MQVKAYAKINLILNVTAKRPDGFHEVDFLMACLNLYDELEITKSSEYQLIGMDNVDIECNLITKAWRLLKTEFDLPAEITVKVNKQIPLAGGMAGGSSDAAAVLRTVNELFALNLTLEQLATYGSTLGSDVPFCIYQQLARAQGRGEKITLLDKQLPPLHVVVINPGVELSTAKVYQNYEVQQANQNVEQFMKAHNYHDLVNSLHNDLQSTAMSLEPKIKEIINYLGQRFTNRLLVSGSGPTVLAFASDQKQAQEIYNFAKQQYSQVYLTEVIDVIP